MVQCPYSSGYLCVLSDGHFRAINPCVILLSPQILVWIIQAFWGKYTIKKHKWEATALAIDPLCTWASWRNSGHITKAFHQGMQAMGHYRNGLWLKSMYNMLTPSVKSEVHRATEDRMGRLEGRTEVLTNQEFSVQTHVSTWKCLWSSHWAQGHVGSLRHWYWMQNGLEGNIRWLQVWCKYSFEVRSWRQGGRKLT